MTCYRVGMRLGEPEMPSLLVSHHRPGFYMRVLREGRIQADDQIVKISTGPHALSVTDTDALLYLPGRDAASWHSLLDLADACDVPTRWSCRAGICHRCVTPLLSGAVSYAPDPLEPPSDGEVLICCSQPRSDIVLDM